MFKKTLVRTQSKLPLKGSPGEGTTCWKSTPTLRSFSSIFPRIKGRQLLKKGNKPYLPSLKLLLKPTVAKAPEKKGKKKKKNFSTFRGEARTSTGPKPWMLFSSQVSSNVMRRSPSYDAGHSACLKLNLNWNNRVCHHDHDHTQTNTPTYKHHHETWQTNLYYEQKVILKDSKLVFYRR